MTLTLVRGLPGSGKSTYAERYCKVHKPTPVHLEADMYFLKDGVYTFNPKLLVKAHQWVLAEAERALCDGQSVIVSNTFTRKWEMLGLMNLASDGGTPVEVRTLFDAGLTDEQLAERCVHSVPVATIRAMRERWEPFDGEVRITGTGV